VLAVQLFGFCFLLFQQLQIQKAKDNVLHRSVGKRQKNAELAATPQKACSVGFVCWGKP
jgi:hypothetical protein